MELAKNIKKDSYLINRVHHYQNSSNVAAQQVSVSALEKLLELTPFPTSNGEKLGDILMNMDSESVKKKLDQLTRRYGNTGCRVFKRGYKIRKIFA